MSHSRQLYPESLRNVALFVRTVGLGLGIALLAIAIILTTRTGDTPPITYVAVIWSLLLNIFDWVCLLSRGRITPGMLMALDLIAMGLLIAGAVNLGIVDWRGDGDQGTERSNHDLTNALRWLQGVLMYDIPQCEDVFMK